MQIGRSPSFWRSCGIRAAALAVALLCAPPASHSNELDAYAKAVSDFKSVLSQRGTQLKSGQASAEPAGTSALSCPQQHDQRVQGPHRRASVAELAGPTSSAFRRRISTPTMSRCWTSTRGSSASCRRRLPMRRTRRRRSRTSSIWNGDRTRARFGCGIAEAAGRISLGMFFAETNGNQNIGNARSNRYKGSFQTGNPRTGTVKRNGRRSGRRSHRSIPRWPPATTRSRRGSAISISVTITGPPCATA